MALYNKKDKKETLQDIFKIILSKPREYSDDTRYHPYRTHRDTNPIGELLSTLSKLGRDREIRRQTITPFPYKGTSQYHR